MPIIGYAINRVFVDTKSRNSDYKLMEPHIHNHYELFYLRKGSCSFFIKSHFYNLVPGSVIIIPPNTLHDVRYTSKQPSVRTSILFREEDIICPKLKFVFDIIAKREHRYVLQIPPMYQIHIEGQIKNMEAEQHYNEKDISSSMLALSLVQLIVLVNRFSTDVDTKLIDDIHTSNRQVNLAATFINRNYTHKISLSDIADASGFSPNYLSRKFKEDTGMGVHEYLNYVRLNKAAIELAHTDHTITEVAMNNGFSDANYFKDAFNKLYGMSPRDYRKKDESSEDPIYNPDDTPLACIPGNVKNSP